MKKQTKKLTLNKKTISNLNSSEMSRVIGGSGPVYSRHGCGTYHNTINCTKNQNTCPGHKTCYTC
jgi:natural product precursor